MKIIKSRVRYKEPESLKTAKAQELNQKPYKPVYTGEYYDKNIDEGIDKHIVASWDYRDPNVAQRVEKAMEQLQQHKVPAGENPYFVRKVKAGMTLYEVEAICTNGVVVGTGQYFEGATCTLTVTPNTHYHVGAASCWTFPSTVTPTYNSDFTQASFVVNDDISGIECTCVEDARHTVTLTSPSYGIAKMYVDGSEIASPYSDYDGTQVTLVFIPATYRQFDSWGNGSSEYTENPYTFPISGDVTFHVNDHSTAYLTFSGDSFTTLDLASGDNIQMCDDDVPTATSTWQNFSSGTAHPVVNNKVHVRGKSTTNIYKFSGTYDTVSGPIMSLVNYDDITVDLMTRQFSEPYTGGKSYGEGLFSGSSIKDASGLIFPDKTAERCYESMFEQCTQLLHYSNLPTLSTQNLSSGCYFKMFYGCTALDEGPQLPATSVPECAYTLMFSGCTSLTRLHGVAIAATSITGDSAMKTMFSGCTSLTTAPHLYTEDLPTPSVDENGCYAGIFNGCTKINTVYCNAENPTENNLKDWITDCASAGYIYGTAEVSVWSGMPTTVIPTNWSYHKQS